jgi:hypothetical protein
MRRLPIHFVRALWLQAPADLAVVEDGSDLKILPRSRPARPVPFQVLPRLGQPARMAIIDVSQQGRVLGQLREGPEDLPLHLRDERRPAAASRWRRGWPKRLMGRSKALHGFYLPHLPHPWRDPPWTGFPATRKTVDLASRLLGAHLVQPPLPSSTHGCQRSRLISSWCYPNGGSSNEPLPGSAAIAASRAISSAMRPPSRLSFASR